VRNERHFSILVLFAAITAAYVNSLGGPFQFDDYSVIVNNSSVHSFSAWLADGGIRPVLKLSYMLNWVSGLGAVGFHLVNVGIHAANTFLVYRLCCLLASGRESAECRGGSNFLAVAVALAFALHPVQTEAVTYVSGRSTSLMAMFYLGSLVTYQKGRKTGSAVYVHLVSPMLFALALMTKEIAVTLPFALLLLEMVMDRRDQPRLSMSAHQAGHWMLLLAALIALALHSGYARLIEVSFETRSGSENLANQANAIIYLLRQLLWPVHLSIDPELPSGGLWTSGAVAKAAFLGALAAMGIVLARRRSVVGFAILWFFIHLAPTNSIVPRLDVVNDRQLYLAGLGFYLATAVGLQRLLASERQRRWAHLAAGAAALALIAMTAMRNRDYRSEVALWESAVQSAPAKARPRHNLGCAYALAARYEDAQRQLQTALHLNPDYALARKNLAAIATPVPSL